MIHKNTVVIHVKEKEVKVTPLCPTLCDPMTVHGILQARILEWVAFPFSRGSSQPRDQTQVSRIAGRFSTSWAAREAQDYWSEEPILPDPGIDPGSPALQANSLPTEPPGKSKNAGVVSTSWQILLEDINSKLKVIILHL